MSKDQKTLTKTINGIVQKVVYTGTSQVKRFKALGWAEAAPKPAAPKPAAPKPAV